MSAELTAYIHGARVGRFVRAGSSNPTFTFDDEWRDAAGRLELSLSMRKSRREHRGAPPINYLWNLLPDNDGVLERWGSKFGVSARNPMALLAHVGLDTAGAVQLSPSDESSLSGAYGFEPISEAEIAAHIRSLETDPDGWILPGHESGYFSLAGAQAKFTLAEMPDGSWVVPTGRSASTHIVKPGVRGLRHSDLNEHLSLVAARALGFDAAESRIVDFEDQTAIIVTRYDRHINPDGSVTRLHQEDFAQAMGVHPSLKYQNDGGASIARIVEQLNRESYASVVKFFEATMLNWVILGTDAHAKNYSLLHDEESGPRLAPLYDVATALPYPDLNQRSAKLAMSFRGHYRNHEITASDVLGEAADVGLNPEWTHTRAGLMLDAIADAYSDAARAAALTGDAAAFAQAIVDRAAERAAMLSRQLDRVTAESAAEGRSRVAQARGVTTPGTNIGSFRASSPADG